VSPSCLLFSLSSSRCQWQLLPSSTKRITGCPRRSIRMDTLNHCSVIPKARNQIHPTVHHIHLHLLCYALLLSLGSICAHTVALHLHSSAPCTEDIITVHQSLMPLFTPFLVHDDPRRMMHALEQIHTTTLIHCNLTYSLIHFHAMYGVLNLCKHLETELSHPT
jgi:hypothetical protein